MGEVESAAIDRGSVVAALLAGGCKPNQAGLYADAYCEYHEAQDNIRRMGAVVANGRTGAAEQNPYLPVRDRAFARLEALHKSGIKLPAGGFAAPEEVEVPVEAPGPLNTRATAKELGISWQRLAALVKEGRVPRNADKTFDLVSVRAAFERDRDPTQSSRIAAEQSAPTGERGFNEVRTEHEEVKLKLAKIELDLTEGRLVQSDRVMLTVGGMIIAAKTRLLAMGNDLADELATESDPVIIRSTLSDKHHDILSELSKWKLQPERLATN